MLDQSLRCFKLGSFFKMLHYLVLSMFCLHFYVLPALSMTFTTGPSPIHRDVTLVVGEGAIERGDAARFEAALRENPPSAPLLMITSPGGEVDAAKELARRVKAYSFSVIAHRECASACAMIVFPAGEYSILTQGSVLGFHTCYVSGVRDDLCNEEIAEFGVSNGFPFGTLKIFSDLYGPGEMKWMTEISARCFGFYRGIDDPKPIRGGRKACVDGVFATMGADVQPRPFGPSFNCSNARTKVEHLFCMDKELMQSDSILGLVYDAEMAKRNKNEKASLRAEQRHWISVRNSACENLIGSTMDFMATRAAALCLYKFNEERIYGLMDNPLLILK